MASARWMTLGACILVAACGGSTTELPPGDGTDGGGTDGAVGNDSGGGNDGGRNDGGGGGSDGGATDGGGSGACPPAAPTGGACPVEGAICEYGSDPNEACNTVAQCTNGQWTFPSHGGSCAHGGTCPATYGDVPQGMKCAPEFLTCPYSEATCICTKDTGPIPSSSPLWKCTPISQGCPSARPPLGTACTQDGLACNYGACSGGLEETCKGGYWQQTPVPCPL